MAPELVMFDWRGRIHQTIDYDGSKAYLWFVGTTQGELANDKDIVRQHSFA